MGLFRRLAGLAASVLRPSADDGSGLRGRLVFIDALRGLAAVVITLHHIDRYEPSPTANSLLPDWFLVGLKEWRIIVQVFFVISGFMIARSLRQTVLTPAAMGKFTLRRLVRLGLPYWTLLAIVLALDLLAPWLGVPALNSEFTAGQLVSEVLFLQDILGYGSTSAGLWFICIEVQFILLFIVLLFVAQRMRQGDDDAAANAGCFPKLAVFAPLALLSLFVFNVNNKYDAWVIYFFGAFFFGTIAWWALDGAVPRAVFWFYMLAAIVRLAVFPAPRLIVALSAAVLIYVVGRLGGLNRWLSAGWLQYLGKISYSLFLVHYPVSHFVKCLGHFESGDSPGVSLVWLGAAFVASLVAADFFYRVVEAPTCRLVERLKTSASRDNKRIAS